MTTIAARAHEYHRDSQRYFPRCHRSHEQAVAHFALGLVGEVEELAEAVDVLLRSPSREFEQHVRAVADEGADVVIYGLMLAYELGLPLDARDDFDPSTRTTKGTEHARPEQIMWAAARTAQHVKKYLRDEVLNRDAFAVDLVHLTMQQTRDLLAAYVVSLPVALDSKRATWKAAR